MHHEKSFVCALFKASVDHLFDNLESGKSLAQATFVQKMDSAIHFIYLYPMDSAIGFPNTYPPDRDLSDG